MALPGSGTLPAGSNFQVRAAKRTGMQIMQLLEKNILPSDIMTPEAFENAIRVALSVSGSTNMVLHLIAIGIEIGVEKLTWGSDCGNDEIADHLANLDQIFDQVGLTEAERDRIRYRNAAEIFGEAVPIHSAE